MPDVSDEPLYKHGTRQFVLACHLALLGDAELAAVALHRATVDYGFFSKVMIWQPQFRQVRQTSAFKQLARDLGFHGCWRSTGNWGDFARPLGDDDFELIA